MECILCILLLTSIFTIHAAEFEPLEPEPLQMLAAQGTQKQEPHNKVPSLQVLAATACAGQAFDKKRLRNAMCDKATFDEIVAQYPESNPACALVVQTGLRKKAKPYAKYCPLGLVRTKNILFNLDDTDAMVTTCAAPQEKIERFLERKTDNPFTNSVAEYSPDGNSVAVGFLNNCIAVIYDKDIQKIVQFLDGHNDGITAVAWNKNSTKIATSSYDHTVKIWDPKTGEQLQSVTDTSTIAKIIFTNYDTFKTMSTYSIKEWHLFNGGLIRTTNMHFTGSPTIFVPDSQHVACIEPDTINFISTDETGEMIVIPHYSENARDVAISPDRAYVYMAVSFALDNSVRIFKIWYGKLHQKISQSIPLQHKSPVNCMAFGNSGLQLFTGNRNTITIWAVATGKKLQTLHNNDHVSSIALSPDGIRMVTGSCDGGLSLWDINKDIAEFMDAPPLPQALVAAAVLDGTSLEKIEKHAHVKKVLPDIMKKHLAHILAARAATWPGSYR